MTFGVDYAWGRPSVASLRVAGVQFVMRYLSHDTTGKNLTHSEAVTLSDAGFWLGVVWESRAMRSLDGRAAGVQDAKDALAQATACGMPAGRPIYFASDWDVQSGQLAAVNAYLDGAASVLGKAHTGIYGGYRAVKAALDGGHCAFAWQTYAWSAGHWDSRAQVQQYLNDERIGGVGLDYDRSTKPDFGQWKVGVSPDVPTPIQEDDMLFGDLYSGAGEVTPISWPKGKAAAIAFFADTGLAGGLVKLRVAFHKGGGKFIEQHIVVDSSKGKTVVSFGADAPNVDAVSVQREGGDDIAVSWDAS